MPLVSRQCRRLAQYTEFVAASQSRRRRKGRVPARGIPHPRRPTPLAPHNGVSEASRTSATVAVPGYPPALRRPYGQINGGAGFGVMNVGICALAAALSIPACAGWPITESAAVVDPTASSNFQ